MRSACRRAPSANRSSRRSASSARSSSIARRAACNRRRWARRCWRGSPPASASSMPAWRWRAARMTRRSPSRWRRYSRRNGWCRGLSRFRRQHPDIRVRLEATIELIDPDRSDIDLGIRVGFGDWRNVKVEFLLAQEVFPVCAPELAARLSTPARHRQAAGHQGQLFEPRMGPVAEALRSLAGHAEGRRQLHRRRAMPRRCDRRPRRDAGLAAFGARRAEGRPAGGALSRTQSVRPGLFSRDLGNATRAEEGRPAFATG